MNQKEYDEIADIIACRRAVWESRYDHAIRHGNEELAEITAAKIGAVNQILADIRRAFNSEAGL